MLSETKREMIYREVIRDLEAFGENGDETTRAQIGRVLMQRGREMALTAAERDVMEEEIFNRLRRLDILEDLIADPGVTEILVNGPEMIFVEREGVLSRCDRRFPDRERLYEVIRRIVSRVDRRVNERNPMVDARLADGSRVCVILPPIALDGPVLAIRKFSSCGWNLHDLAALGMMSKITAGHLEQAVRDRKTIFVSGGTGSGKTTFLNALALAMEKNERVVTIEDAAELRLQLENLVRLEVREAGEEGTPAVTIRQLIRQSLRLRPDRILVGEVRDGAAMDMLAAMNTGHPGSMSSGHANSPEDMIARLETMCRMAGELPLPAIRAQIAGAIDLIVHLERDRNGFRRVVSVMEVTGYDKREDRICLSPAAWFEKSNQTDEPSMDSEAAICMGDSGTGDPGGDPD